MSSIVHITKANDLSISNNQLVMIDENNNKNSCNSSNNDN